MQFRARRVALRDEVLDELVRELDRLAEADEVFGVHGFGSVENGGHSVRTRFECAAVFVLFCRGETRDWGEMRDRAKFGA